MERHGLRNRWWQAATLWAVLPLLWAGTAKSAAAQEQQQQSGSGSQSEEKTAGDANAAQNNGTPNSAAGAAAKPASKPKHVITNDDLKPSAFASFGGLFYFSTGSINDCDSACFDQVHMMSPTGLEKNPNWRTQVLRDLELVRSSGPWQAYLHTLYGAHNKICQLTFDKQDELRRSGNARNLGPQEIAIAEKYEEQMKAAQDELNGEVARQSAEQKLFAEKPYANAFATVQGTRMMGGFCSQAKVIYPTIVYP
jgi:hypothetical protein